MIPVIDPETEKLGAPFFNQETDMVNYEILTIEQPTIDELKERLTAELKVTMLEFSAMIQMGTLLYGEEPGLTAAIETIRAVKNQTVQDISTKSYEELKLYRIRQEDIAYLKGLLTPYLI